MSEHNHHDREHPCPGCTCGPEIQAAWPVEVTGGNALADLQSHIAALATENAELRTQLETSRMVHGDRCKELEASQAREARMAGAIGVFFHHWENLDKAVEEWKRAQEARKEAEGK